ncbi:MAG: hypothetical protein HFJ09_14135 [Lachnospiraceae bacterium]|nr:hypothetical protein [Lachnospiraceae bacterium]
MKRRLVIEMESVVNPDCVIQDVFEVLMKYANCNTEFTLRQEILPEKSSGELQIPVFVKGGDRDGKVNN